MKTKKLIQRNLPITETYSIVSSFYSPLENGNFCQNCGRPISNVAEVKCSNGNTYSVGMDCAETLSGIKDDFFTWEYIHKAAFQEAKSARASLLKCVNKCKKDDHPYQVTIHKCDDGDIGFDFMPQSISKYGRRWKYFNGENWDRYVYPMIKDLITSQLSIQHTATD